MTISVLLVASNVSGLVLVTIRNVKQICSKARMLVGLLFQQFYNSADPSTIRLLYLTPDLYSNMLVNPYLIRDRSLLQENIQKFACKVCLKTGRV